MKFHQLEALAACADAGSVRAAARQLGVSQPAVTQAIRDLEARQQLSLVIRSPTGLQFTEDGRVLLAHARLILNQIRTAQAQMEVRRGRMEGRLSVALTPWLSDLFLDEIIVEFKRQMPKVQLEFFDSMEIITEPLLRDGTIDLSIAHADQSYRQLYDVDPLLEYETAIIVRRGHPKQDAKSIHDLLDCNWIVQNGQGQREEAMEQLFWRHGVNIDEGRIFFVNSVAIVRSLTISLDMCAIGPRIITDMEPFSDVFVSLDLKEKFRPGVLSITSRKNNPMGQAAQCFGDSVRHVLRKKLHYRVEGDGKHSVGPLLFLK